MTPGKENDSGSKKFRFSIDCLEEKGYNKQNIVYTLDLTAITCFT